MSALSLLTQLDQERNFLVDELQRCRFCGCVEDHACMIQLREDDTGKFLIAQTEAEMTVVIPCGWYVPGVCSAPVCVEKLFAESRRPIILDGDRRHA